MLRKTKLLTQKRRLLTRYAKTLTEPRISTKSSQNQSSKVEKNETTDIEEKALNPLRKDGDTEQRISTKSSQNQSRKVEKTKLLT